MLKISESWDTCQGELLMNCRTSPREKSVLQSTNLKRSGDLKSTLISDIEMLSLEFASLVFGLVLVQYFLIMILFAMVMYILCHCMLETCDLLFDSVFIGGDKRLPQVS